MKHNFLVAYHLDFVRLIFYFSLFQWFAFKSLVGLESILEELKYNMFLFWTSKLFSDAKLVFRFIK